MTKKLIAQGAEAKLFLEKNILIKERTNKNYRIKELDDVIRKKTTRAETKILQKALAIIPVPKILESNDKEMIIKMEFIKGDKLKDVFENLAEFDKICNLIGQQLAKLHNNDIIHGDLTTSNMILNNNLFFIDFGLSFHSNKIEDKAVDLHLLQRALESKHHLVSEHAFSEVLKGYQSADYYKEILNRLEQVGNRGRYKRSKIS